AIRRARLGGEVATPAGRKHRRGRGRGVLFLVGEDALWQEGGGAGAQGWLPHAGRAAPAPVVGVTGQRGGRLVGREAAARLREARRRHGGLRAAKGGARGGVGGRVPESVRGGRGHARSRDGGAAPPLHLRLARRVEVRARRVRLRVQAEARLCLLCL